MHEGDSMDQKINILVFSGLHARRRLYSMATQTPPLTKTSPTKTSPPKTKRKRMTKQTKTWASAWTILLQTFTASLWNGSPAVTRAPTRVKRRRNPNSATSNSARRQVERIWRWKTPSESSWRTTKPIWGKPVLCSTWNRDRDKDQGPVHGPDRQWETRREERTVRLPRW